MPAGEGGAWASASVFQVKSMLLTFGKLDLESESMRRVKSRGDQ
jgi:hypothetical protein